MAVPFMFVTAKADRVSELAGLRAGAVDYVIKPFSASVLTEKITSLLSYTDAMFERLREDIVEFTENWKERGSVEKRENMGSTEERIDRIASEYDLTKRQQSVLQLLLKGYTSKEIGKLLSISPRTVDNHVRVIMKKVGVKRRSQLHYDVFDDDTAPAK